MDKEELLKDIEVVIIRAAARSGLLYTLKLLGIKWEVHEDEE